MSTPYPDIEGQLYTVTAPDATYMEAEARQRAATAREVEAAASAAGASALVDAKAYTDARAGAVSREATAYTDARVGAATSAAERAALDASRAAASADGAQDAASHAEQIAEALAAAGGLSPESPADGQTAALVSGADTLTGQAVDERLSAAVKVDIKTEGYYPNIYLGGQVNGADISDAVHGGVILNPGSTNYANIIGGDGRQTVGTATPNVVDDSIRADGGLVGGIDNVVGQISDKIISAHSYSAPHPTMPGGYGHSGMIGGAYHVIGPLAGHVGMAGGSQNTVNGGYSGTVGGSGITIHGERTFSTGINNTIWAANSACFGTGNTVGAEGVSPSSNAANTLVAGRDHVVKGSNAAVVGIGHTVEGMAVTAGGTKNTATPAATGAVVFGSNNTVSGIAAQAVGYNNVAAGNYSRAAGWYAEATGPYQDAYGGGAFNNLPGSAQRLEAVASRESTSASAGNLTVAMAPGVSWSFTAQVVASAVDTQDTAAWEVKGAIKVPSAGGGSVFVGTPSVTLLGADTAAEGWSVVALAHPSGGLGLTTRGAPDKAVRWVASVTAVQVKVA